MSRQLLLLAPAENYFSRVKRQGLGGGLDILHPGFSPDTGNLQPSAAIPVPKNN